MKVALVSNFLNHHQIILCDQFMKSCEEFYFIATEKVPESKLAFGYDNFNSKYDYVIRTYESEYENERAKQIIKNSDAVILGSCPYELITLRMKENKLTFIYAERPFKKGIYRRYIPQTRKKLYDSILKYKNKNLYLLCASAYTSYDLSLCGFHGKCFKWGYFPEIKKFDITTLMNSKNHEKIKILWAGRFISWKRAKDAIFVANLLKENGYTFTMDIIGTGKLEKKLQILVKRLNLSQEVSFLGSMPYQDVRKQMESANIFLCTSNFMEGWGTVLFEAMGSGCAVVSSHSVGSVPFFLNNKINGLVYKYGDINDFYKKVKLLMDNQILQYEYGVNAYNTMLNLWNGEITAKRFIKVSEKLLSGSRITFYKNGPCSKAAVVKNNWFKED